MFNKAILIGRLCADPELRQTSSGIYVCSYRIAVDRRFSRDAERKADFLSVVSWRQQGEFVSKYFHKGSMAVVSGRLQIRSYQDREGNNRTAAEVVAENVYFGESRRDSDNRGTSAAYGNSYGGYEPPRGAASAQSPFQELGDEDGDLPF